MRQENQRNEMVLWKTSVKSVGCTHMLIGTEFVVGVGTKEQDTVHAFMSSQPNVVILPVLS